jgi:hypothetical protein
MELGVAARLASALRVIRDQLCSDPQTWGDPVRTYHTLGLTAYRRMYEDLLVNYVVHPVERIVWLDSVLPVLTHPLNPEHPGE